MATKFKATATPKQTADGHRYYSVALSIDGRDVDRAEWETHRSTARLPQVNRGRSCLIVERRHDDPEVSGWPQWRAYYGRDGHREDVSPGWAYNEVEALDDFFRNLKDDLCGGAFAPDSYAHKLAKFYLGEAVS
jgi:hypothetical protein